MQWWMDLMPPELTEAEISYQGKTRQVAVPAKLEQVPVLRGAGPRAAARAVEVETETEETDASGHELAAGHGHTDTVVTVEATPDPDLVMLIRPRQSRIYYLRKFFDYPIKLTGMTLRNLGVNRTLRVGTSYLASRVKQITPEKSLEDFLINRFGRELYLTFFKSYTEKVWGTPCNEISAEWGAQRIKGLSLTTAVKHFVRKTLKGSSGDVAQKGVDTSLIERFMYPKFGPGQLWEHVADQVIAKGGELHLGWKVERVLVEGSRVTGVEAVNAAGKRRSYSGEYFFSTMPMRELTEAMSCEVPANVREVSAGLQYRDFITVGLLWPTG